jgi:cellulose synthase/poly-beta-1,6-N-acetylglucosamine synthase-like glycosyltransferase
MLLLFCLEMACAAFFVGCVLCLVLLSFFLSREKREEVHILSQAPQARFAVIVPARNESAVIEGNLRALQNADYPAELRKTYVIVESMQDPTVAICAKYPNTEIYLRRNYDRPGKGPALDECLKSIFATGEEFDAVLLMDADNVIAPNFFSRLNDAYLAGYDAACGKRNNKDWNSSATSAASGLIFTVINTLQNKVKAARGMNVVFTGTGFYIRYDILKQLGGWPFVTMTEDYEFSTYALCNGIKTTYVEDAIYYDEQPTGLWQSILQRTRWVKGFFSVQKRYRRMKKEYAKRTPKSKDIRFMKMGTVPMLGVAIDLLVYLFVCIGGAVYTGIVHNGWLWSYLLRLGCWVACVYVVILLFTAWLFFVEREDIRISRWNKLKAVLFNPIYLFTFVIAVCRIPLIKNKWEVIRHHSNAEVES